VKRLRDQLAEQCAHQLTADARIDALELAVIAWDGWADTVLELLGPSRLETPGHRAIIGRRICPVDGTADAVGSVWSVQPDHRLARLGIPGGYPTAGLPASWSSAARSLPGSRRRQ
jgi:hypothetical protein